MDMEVIIPPVHVQNLDFDFNKSPLTPSTPRPFGFADYYHSAPTSPSRLSASNYQHEFAFHSTPHMDHTTSLSADQLFDAGIIRPLNPPPLLQTPPLTPKSHRKTTDTNVSSPRKVKRTTEQERGRERVSSLTSSDSRRRPARSLSPNRVSEYPWEEEEEEDQQLNTNQSSPIPPSKTSTTTTTTTTTVLTTSSSKGHRKWRLKDFFLFRSASEGRATGKDPLKKYASLFKQDVKQHSSFRKIDSPAGSGSQSSRRGPVSAHELHYTMNRAVSEDLKKKTFLPYKQGILGRLAFNPAVHALANGFGFSHQ